MDLSLFADVLQSDFGIDIRGYRSPFIQRRLQARMHMTSCASFEEYRVLLDKNVEERVMLTSAFSIPISKFMRDPWLFAYLGHVAFPELLESIQRKKHPVLRIWSAGCSAGQEIYSIAILLTKLGHRRDPGFNPFLIGTDIDQLALDNARQGVYGSNDVENLTLADLDAFFTREGSRYRINPELRSRVVFARHNLLGDQAPSPPESLFREYDIILCRNVMMYFHREEQRRIFQKLHRSLVTGGLIALGECEYPYGELRDSYQQCDGRTSLYQKL
jgi:chemotaxis methyl-accepting protein methylase